MNHLPEETKRKISEAHKGKMPKNIELLKKLAEQKKGKPYTEIWGHEVLFDEASPSWKGDNIKYSALHKWVTRKLGKATYCSSDISHKRFKFQWANISGAYKRELSDFMPLCLSCHKLYDKGNFCKYGHEFTVNNVYNSTDKNGYKHRMCKRCNAIRSTKNYWRNKQAI